MSGFRFRLERVRNWRQTRLTIAENQLEQLRGEEAAIIRAGASLRLREAGSNTALCTTQSMDGAEMMRLASERRSLQREDGVLKTRATATKKAIDAKQIEATDARRHLRLIEKLRDRRQASWLEESNRQSDALAAEAAIASWRRGKSNRLP